VSWCDWRPSSASLARFQSECHMLILRYACHPRVHLTCRSLEFSVLSPRHLDSCAAMCAVWRSLIRLSLADRQSLIVFR
jgi:hypothetical protein